MAVDRRPPQSEPVARGTPWFRRVVALVGLALLGYGAVLAWRASSSDVVLATGALLLLVAFLVPDDWRKLSFGLPGGGSLDIERVAAIAQETLRSLPREAQQEIVQAQEIPQDAEAEAQAAEEPEGEAAPVEAPARAETRASQLAHELVNRQAFVSHEVATRWIHLRLKRRVNAVTSVIPVTCAVRKPDGTYLTGVPRLIGPSDPPMILGTFSLRQGAWLDYEAIFPDFFVEADADLDAELPPGDYLVAWGTASVGAGSHVLTTDRFTWPGRRT